MNKKLLGILLVLAIPTVFAISYYVTLSTTFNVNNIDGLGEFTQELGEFEFGDIISGDSIYLLNDLENDRSLLITDNSGENIEVTYKSNLELTKKTVDFNLDKWEVLENKVQIEYTLVGDEFSAEIVGDEIPGYILIYYKDNSDRFVNPAKAILIEDVEGNLPYETDGNLDEYDYCETDEYLTCNGAKIWYIPSDAITEGVIDWTRASEFYFESKLIQYNSDGEIVLYSGEELETTPEYTPNEHAEGSYEIVTTIA